MSKHFLYHLPNQTKFNFNHPHCHKIGETRVQKENKSSRPNDRVDHNDFNHNNTSGNSVCDIQKMSICILLTKGMLPLVSIQHDTPRHRAYGYFGRSGKFGFSGSHVGTFCIHRSTPIAINDHRLPQRL